MHSDRHSVISTKTRLRVGLPGNNVLIPGRDKESALGPTHPPIPLVLASVSLREKWPLCADVHKPSSSAEVKGGVELHVPIRFLDVSIHQSYFRVYHPRCVCITREGSN